MRHAASKSLAQAWFAVQAGKEGYDFAAASRMRKPDDAARILLGSFPVAAEMKVF
jgi:hypothetical protein